MDTKDMDKDIEEFRLLLERDPQVRYAQNAVRYYRAVALPGYLERDPHRKAVVQKLSGVVHSAMSAAGSSVNLNAGGVASGITSASGQGSRASTPAPGIQGSNTTTTAGSNSNSSGPGGNVRRHIINVDDMSKINYEMVKNVPGNFASRAGVVVRDGIEPDDDDDQQALEVEANAVKTKIYKGRLFDDNDSVLEHLGEQMTRLQEERGQEEEVQLPLREQLECVEKVQRNLLRVYNQSLEEEKKWYILKELMLDANAELDLFSTQNYSTKVVNLGDSSASSQNTASVLVFDRTKRRKLDGQHSNIL
ncbi:Ies3p [Nakaseomyces bracarensis]|uniref:Ies3p n=1 Tax=Nakaseomyces bracarensis TaxID=273131 RepID=UPI0038725D3F